MGFRKKVYAFDVRHKDGVLAALGFLQDGEPDKKSRTRFFGGDYGSTYLLIWEEPRHVFITYEMEDAASVITDIVCLSVNETVMVSAVTCHSSGQHVWSITHESEKGLTDIGTFGEPPVFWLGLRDVALSELSKNDDADHLFDVPIQVFERLTGFRHDAEYGVDFVPLAHGRLQKRHPFWKFWKKPSGGRLEKKV